MLKVATIALFSAFFINSTTFCMKYQNTVSNILNLYKDEQFITNRLSIYKYAVNTQDLMHLWDNVWNISPVKNNDHVLDIGCGDGFYWKHNSNKLPKSYNLMLTDLSHQMLNLAQRNTQNFNNPSLVSYQIADAQNLPFKTEVFDKICCHFVLFYAAYPKKALAEIQRVLKNTGTASIITLNKNWCEPLYKIAHNLNNQFPSYDQTTTRFDEEKADKLLAHFFETCKKQIFEIELKIDENEDLTDFLTSLSYEYAIEIDEAFIKTYHLHINEHIKKYGPLKCFSRIALYLCAKKTY